MEPTGSPARLAVACSVRVLRLDGISYEVAVPTVRQGVEVLECAQSFTAGETEDLVFMMDQVLAPWFSEELMEAFGGCPFTEQMEFLRHVLFTGAELPERKEEKPSEDAPADDWADLVASYCMVYGGEPWRVYNEVPFPFFLTMMMRTDKHRARANLMASEVVLLPHIGKKSRGLIASMKRRAGYVERKPTEEDFARDRKALRHLASQMGQ